MEEDIQVKRETTEVKVTYAAHQFNRTQSDMSQSNSHFFNNETNYSKANAQQEIARDIDAILQSGIPLSSDFNNQHQNHFQHHINHQPLTMPQQIVPQGFQINQEQIFPKNLFSNINLQSDIIPSSHQANNYQPHNFEKAQPAKVETEEYDYLDYKENEERLDNLRKQNLSLYSNFLQPQTDNRYTQDKEQELRRGENGRSQQSLALTEQLYGGINHDDFMVKFNKDNQNFGSDQIQLRIGEKKAETNQGSDDLDSCFQHLNLMLGGGNGANASNELRQVQSLAQLKQQEEDDKLRLAIGRQPMNPQSHLQSQMQLDAQSCFSITPIKYNQSINNDSPKSLLPNYQELFNFNAPKVEDIIKPIQRPVMLSYNLAQAPMPSDYEPQLNTQKTLLTPHQVLSGQSLGSLDSGSNSQLVYPQKMPSNSYSQASNSYPAPQILAQTYIPAQQPQPQNQGSKLPQFVDIQSSTMSGQQLLQQKPNANLPGFSTVVQNPFTQTTQSQHYPRQQQQDPAEEEEDSDFARMREMLLSTQQEIDKIIQGTSNINQIYQSSKNMTEQQQVLANPNVNSQAFQGQTYTSNGSTQSHQLQQQNSLGQGNQYQMSNMNSISSIHGGPNLSNPWQQTSNYSLSHTSQQQAPSSYHSYYQNPDSLSLRNNVSHY